jgi:acetyl esterase/lipase
MKPLLPFLAMSLAALTTAFAADPSPKPTWPAEVVKIEIPASDGAVQPAMWYVPAGKTEFPLLVGLHTWSGGFDQTINGPDYAAWCQKNGWAFIHPHFRGPNRSPEAMGSPRAIQDVVEAVEWALTSQPGIDKQRIYLVGCSGGAYMALLMAAKHPEIWAGISAWCPISDIAQWHADHTKNGVPGRYAQDIEAALGGAPTPGSEFARDAEERSPLKWLGNARKVPLDINAGVQDGRKGSVPFTHSLLAFNAVLGESSGYGLDPAKIQEYCLTQKLPQNWIAAPPDALYAPWETLYRRVINNTRVTIFSGAHEISYQAALNWLAAQRQGRNALWHLREDSIIPFTGQAAEMGK